jgi:hypothetical protein
MSIDVVNGYVCQTCSDVSLAKKGIDPSDAKSDPSSPNYDPASTKAATERKSERASAVTFGGQLSGLNGATTVTDPTAQPSTTKLGQPERTYQAGAISNVYA